MPNQDPHSNHTATPLREITRWALYYRSLGWSVLPVKVSWNGEKKKWEKTPLVKWQPYQEQHPTEDQIIAWFEKEFTDQFTYIGAVTGKISGIVVVDCDAGSNPEKFPKTVTSKTISGGSHLFYQYPGRHVAGIVGLRPSVDIRGDGNFVVVPSGTDQYAWVHHPNAMALAPYPRALLAAAAAAPKPRVHDMIQKDLEIPEGMRNASYSRFIWKLLHEVEPELWDTVVLPAALDFNRRQCKPPEAEEKVIASYRSAVKKLQAQGLPKNGDATKPWSRNAPQGREPKQKDTRVISRVLDDGDTLLETVVDPTTQRTGFAIFRGGEVQYTESAIDRSRRLIPYLPDNSLIQNEVILFPSRAELYESEETLVAEVRSFIHRYVDITPLYEQLAAYYILFTWLYDRFQELPYLRVKGDAGSGKTRFLLAVGSLCYKPIFASGASTTSPIFRILDEFAGTLVIDEGDFRATDEKADIIKILNNGNAKGFVVLRTEIVEGRQKEFSPRAYKVYGPKLVATRSPFQDRALESRCLTEEMGHRKLRPDIPINLTAEFKHEAHALRNKLLMFRFTHYQKTGTDPTLVDRTIEPRLNQVFVPLMSVIQDEQARADLKEVLREYQRQMVADRGLEAEAQVVEILREVQGQTQGGNLPLREITSLFIERYGEEFDRKITPKWVGSRIRKLGLKTAKAHGNFVIPRSESPKLEHLYTRYGLDTEPARSEPLSAGDLGTSGLEVPDHVPHENT